MFKNILVPTDFLDDNQHALEIAIRLCSMDNGKISLLHVIEVIQNTTFEEFEDFYSGLEKRSFKGLNDIINRLDISQAEVEPQVVYGNRTQEIVRYAEENNVDLIIMKSHKVDLEEPIQGWGTISYKVSILARCPVLLVK
ncbi:MAG: universal stress protein [Deltaproteobacteria bacterium]|jgi:universal stress protein A|nr:universal stress protein [Deltaproteobacteria bacterium]